MAKNWVTYENFQESNWSDKYTGNLGNTSRNKKTVDGIKGWLVCKGKADLETVKNYKPTTGFGDKLKTHIVIKGMADDEAGLRLLSHDGSWIEVGIHYHNSTLFARYRDGDGKTEKHVGGMVATRTNHKYRFTVHAEPMTVPGVGDVTHLNVDVHDPDSQTFLKDFDAAFTLPIQVPKGRWGFFNDSGKEIWFSGLEVLNGFPSRVRYMAYEDMNDSPRGDFHARGVFFNPIIEDFEGKGFRERWEGNLNSTKIVEGDKAIENRSGRIEATKKGSWIYSHNISTRPSVGDVWQYRWREVGGEVPEMFGLAFFEDFYRSCMVAFHPVEGKVYLQSHFDGGVHQKELGSYTHISNQTFTVKIDTTENSYGEGESDEAVGGGDGEGGMDVRRQELKNGVRGPFKFKIELINENKPDDTNKFHGSIKTRYRGGSAVLGLTPQDTNASSQVVYDDVRILHPHQHQQHR